MTKAAVSEARWGLLRSALLGRECSTENKEASIHRFAGWNLLKKEKADLSDDSTDDDYILTFDGSDCHHKSELLQYEILAWQCLLLEKGNLKIKSSGSKGWSDSEIKELREQLGRQGILARVIRHDDDGLVLGAKWSYCSYLGKQYSLDQFNNSIKLLVRERKPKSKVALRELMSHDLHQGVDNTGQTCVWDSESTLTFCLLSKSSSLCKLLPDLCQLSSSHKVIELGVGMAGLAGLALAQLAPVQVLLTDGHPMAVDNNKVNIQMNRRKLLGKVHCEQLLWSTDIQQHPGEFDFLLCSDCTHFQEHHASLMVTLGHVLKIQGTAILCQPPRGKSLERFMTLCDSIEGLWETIVVSDGNLERLHEESRKNPLYDPNIHCPRIIILKKLRQISVGDRRSATGLVRAYG